MTRKILASGAAIAACATLTCCSVVQDVVDNWNNTNYDTTEAGSCFHDGYNVIKLLSCLDEHNAESVGSYESSAATREEGRKEAREERCPAMVADWVGPNWETYVPELHADILWISSEEDWETKHKVTCYVKTQGDQLTSSLKDATP
ncbi:MAG: hypothetical protein FWF02_05120 [Micrococcales bacterium]|nr:hypothetical protein [Micrococcales bacterium]MCL2667074.1 hypothetical protein [Micrococcales bacterium]